MFGYILALEYVAHHGWTNVWLESDSSNALHVFKNISLVLILLRNWWLNARNLHIQVISSHIFQEGNMCADRLANLGHSVVGQVWMSALPSEFQQNIFTDRCGLPRFRFP